MSNVSIIKCGNYAQQTVDDAIHQCLEPLGGLANFVKPGQKVLIKPNALMGSAPELAVTTHPAVIAAVVKAVSQTGGKALVGDSPGNAYANVERSMIAAGIKKATEDAGGQMIYFQQGGVELIDGLPIAKAVLEADVIINLAKLKTHGLTLYTGAVKNMFGAVPGFHKSYFHINYPNPSDFAGAIVDVFQATKPALNIIDAVVGMEGRGPSEGKPRRLGVIIASTDAVATDAVGSYLIGYDPFDINTTAIAHRRKLGVGDLKKIEIIGPDLNDIRQADWQKAPNISGLISRLPPSLYKLIAGQLKIDPLIDQTKCAKCLVCVRNCPAKTIKTHPPAMGKVNPPPSLFKRGGKEGSEFRVEIDLKDCIHCFCCHELCEFKAIKLEKSWLARLIRI